MVAALVAVSVPMLGGDSDTATEPTDRTDTGEIATSPSTPTPPPGPAAVDPNNPWPDLEYTEGWWDMPLEQQLAALEERLPAGVRIVDANADAGPGDTSDLDVILEGPTGTGRFALMMRPKLLPEDEMPDPVTSIDARGRKQTHMLFQPDPYAQSIGCRGTSLACELIRDETGHKIGDVSTETDGGTTYHNAELLGPDGGAMNLYVADSNGDKPGHEGTTAEAPPLTFEQVRALIQDPIWTSYQP